MTVAELLDRLRRLDISVRLEGERLRLNAPKDVLTPELAAQLRERRAELIEFLQKAREHSARSGIVPLQWVARPLLWLPGTTTRQPFSMVASTTGSQTVIIRESSASINAPA